MLPFFDDKEDRELVHLLHFLNRLSPEPDVRPLISSTYMLHHVHSPGFSEAIDGVIEYTILEVDEIDLDQMPDFRLSLVGSKSEAVLNFQELSGRKESRRSLYDEDVDSEDLDEGVFCNFIGQIHNNCGMSKRNTKRRITITKTVYELKFDQ